MDPQIKIIVDGILAYIKQQKLEKFLPQIVTALSAHVGSLDNRAVVSTAVSLSPARQKTVSDTLRFKFPGLSDIEFNVDPALAGGLVVRIGHKVVDLSLIGKIKNLNEQI
jgi:F0F1-type ATP synthase delta subunit